MSREDRIERTAEEKAKLLDAYQKRSGTLKEFLRENNISSSGLLSRWSMDPKIQLLRGNASNGTTPAKPVDKGEKPDWPTIVADYRNGNESYAQVAKRHGVTHTALIYHCTKSPKIAKAKTSAKAKPALSSTLTCPKCGCDIVAELQQLLLKFKALESLNA